MSDWLSAALLGVIEGITEFLPVSSTGHLLIAEHWLGQRSDLFNIAIQAGAILAVVLIYRRRLWALTTGFFEPDNRDYALKLGTAFVITAVLGLIVKQLGFSLPTRISPVAWALVIGGVWIFVAEYWAEQRPASSRITWTVAIVVGIAQIVAGVFPGTSRSAATIFAAMLAGTSDRGAATEFSFLVGIPTMFAATGYELLDTLTSRQSAGAVPADWGAIAIAFVISTVVAFVAIAWLLRYIRSHRFTVFAWYRIVFGGALLLLL